ncbi:UNVERIFIED_CONTAM: hypothetical protein K2H54_034658 [Gekko kuhli]
MLGTWIDAGVEGLESPLLPIQSWDPEPDDGNCLGHPFGVPAGFSPISPTQCPARHHGKLCNFNWKALLALQPEAAGPSLCIHPTKQVRADW